ncbi:MAG TPA: DegV family protein [Ktedonobacteraceae bacterium]|jgi:DegV family protein with EDD domain|nr:DegV family protein [Ktedonobacteraceae bacterium]
MAVRIVTDSTVDLPIAQAEAEGITIVPLSVFFEDEAYLDGVELDNAGFYRKLATSKSLPRTSQPPPAAFQEAYTRLINEGADGILSIHLSSKLSGTYQSACNSRDHLPDDLKTIPIEVVDSLSISAGMSRSILEAAAQARAGKSLAEIKAYVEDQLSRTRILAVLDTLEWVKRGGRIGAARALLGNMLSVKPIVTLRDGAVVPVEQPRTRSKAYARVAQLIKEAGPIESIDLAISNDEVAEQLTAAIQEIAPGEIHTYKLGAALGTHTGPGTAAVAYTVAHK